MYRLKSQYMECMQCNSSSVDIDDYNAMLEWFDRNDMQYSIDPTHGDLINFKLVEQWIEYKLNLKNNGNTNG